MKLPIQAKPIVRGDKFTGALNTEGLAPSTFVCYENYACGGNVRSLAANGCEDCNLFGGHSIRDDRNNCFACN